MGRILIISALAFALLAPFASATTNVSPASAPGDVLPDLNQVTPDSLEVQHVIVRGRDEFRLGFDSATENLGPGPLTIHGFRPNKLTPRMQVDQLVTQRDGSTRLIRGVGEMQYVRNPDHNHWHFLDFARYELRPAGGFGPTRRGDRKTGFCLGDRYRAHGARSLPGFQPFPAQGDTCGLGKTGLVGLFAGISTGYGDEYAAQLEGQYIDITGIVPGRWNLVHTENANHRLLESDYTNNSSSLLVTIDWPGGMHRMPSVRILKRCPETPKCL
jgi:hypothetical protein